MPRPIPLHGQIELLHVDFHARRRRALADGRIDEREGAELIRYIVTEYMPKVANLTALCGAMAAAFAGSNGLDSPRFMEHIDAHRARPANVVPFVRHEQEGGDAA